jgi:hypothetical protein
MKSLIRTTGCAALLLGSAMTAPAQATAFSAYQGEARDADNRLLYEEHHWLRLADARPQERLVLYRCPSGETFARKTVRYGDALQRPEFALVDVRFGYREGFELGSSFVQRDDSTALRRQAVRTSERLVVDAGFDEFVRANWDALQRGDSQRLDFLLPSRLSTYGFRVIKLREEQLHGEPASVFQLGLSGVFGWFSDTIEVSYRDRDRRLMRFQGTTNIRIDPLRNVTARIEFPPAREAQASEGDWYDAEREPLQACALGG